jgi:hypothetical protein
MYGDVTGTAGDRLPMSILQRIPNCSFHQLFPEKDALIQLTISPVPEPGTMLLFGSGLLVFGIIVHRKKLHVRDGLIDG